jgi:hypothetical protein
MTGVPRVPIQLKMKFEPMNPAPPVTSMESRMRSLRINSIGHRLLFHIVKCPELLRRKCNRLSASHAAARRPIAAPGGTCKGRRANISSLAGKRSPTEKSFFRYSKDSATSLRGQACPAGLFSDDQDGFLDGNRHVFVYLATCSPHRKVH